MFDANHQVLNAQELEQFHDIMDVNLTHHANGSSLRATGLTSRLGLSSERLLFLIINQRCEIEGEFAVMPSTKKQALSGSRGRVKTGAGLWMLTR